ncbi:MAG: NADH-quinone oxidoreductase subunit D [Alphaproteobacteria bacterium]|nr:NADH-quinone oxidoreductase subunit D [Alphaproteobacteria bacterium]MCB9796369.1 NADH-quinone oxidoreductase subunit D [Alphaproteobacteria bacterium]
MSTDVKLPAGVEPVQFDELSETMVVNIGPAHPITHGTLRVQLEIDGENILRAGAEIGYLHRGYEKQSEACFYNMVVPYAERMNYCSTVHNGNAWAYACEQLIGIEAPPRAQAIRVITSEMSRLTDHCICLGANIVDLGALTNFWYLNNFREKLLLLFEELTGQRMMTNYPRIGGVVQDLPDGWAASLHKAMEDMTGLVGDVKDLLLNNRIFIDRTQHIAPIDAETALNFGYTGPCARACGIDMDLRRDEPYWGYDKYDFKVPVYQNGDTLDRFLVRFDEMEESRRIILQAIESLPDGPHIVDDHLVALPPKDAVYNTMEGLINHFKLVMHGIQPERGEVYSYTEAANGELGFYIVSDGSPRAYRVRVRPPCFANYSAFPQMIQGAMVADVAAALGSINIIAGELDR